MKPSIKIILGFAIPLSLAAINVSAQEITDGAKYAQTMPLGTARSIGVGGAMGSVGGDFTSLSINPAGIGIYRSSEFMLTPGLRFSSSNSKYTGNATADNNVRFGFNNVGVVFTDAASENNYERTDWKATSFGFGLNRIADFSRTYNYEGRNSGSSASQYYEGQEIKNGNYTTPNTPAYLGYESYLLNDNLQSVVPVGIALDQYKTVQERGGINEMTISGGWNYKDKLMIGATLGIDFLRHKIDNEFQEQTVDVNASDSFSYLNNKENIKTTGAGINLKLGAIYKVNDYFRAGIAFHTPTIYSLTEIYNTSLSTDTRFFHAPIKVSADENLFEYSITTPYKAIASATGILGKYGFISLDYEMVGYNTMRYRAETDPAFAKDNNAMIKRTMKSASNIRVGLELKFDQLFLRGGYGFYGSPFKNELYQSNRNNISVGLGYRFSRTFIDVAVVNSSYKTSEQPYTLDGSLGYTQPPTATIKNSLTSGVITIGWKL